MGKEISLQDAYEKIRECIPKIFNLADVVIRDDLHDEMLKDSCFAADILFDSFPDEFIKKTNLKINILDMLSRYYLFLKESEA